MNKFNQLATKQQINRTMKAMKAHGITALFAESGAEAKKKVFELIPSGAEIMTMTSVTLDTLGIPAELNHSGRYDSVRARMAAKKATESQKRKLGGGPDWTVGSVQALTEDGKLLIASNTGSQLGAYAYGAEHVIWIIGAQKIVKDVDAGVRRIYEYVLPLESERANQAYRITTGSNISKLLIFNEEIAPNRVTAIIVNEVLGF